MRMATSLASFFLLFCVLGMNFFFGRSQAADEEKDRQAALEKALRECPVANVGVLPGRTSPWEIAFAEGCAIRRAVFRYVDRPRPQVPPDSYKYDIAAYELTKLLGVELIPPVVEREIQGRKGTVQVYIENCIRERDRRRRKLEPPDAKAFRNAVEGMKVFENLAYDECSNINDLYIHREDWRVCRIDFSEAFAPMRELLPGCGITVCSRKLYKGLLELDEEAVRKTLGQYLSQEEIDACLVRRNLILEKINGLIAESGEEDVLF